MTRPPLLPFDEALERLLSQATPVDGIETLPIMAAHGRVLARALRSTIDVPRADNTQMDGYALRAAEGPAGARLPVSQRIPAGHVGGALEPGTAARIFTGGLIPPGADAVVMQEMTEADGDTVIIREAPAPGQWIRRAGEDIREGAEIL
ncbi:MAG: molybdopterin molybdenumtransferase MoeA, partial [Burkholderiaceae bacterium]